MPSLTFVLPHWLYWGTLLLFPFVAMYFVARQKRLGAPREPLLFNAYLFWLLSGFMGIHRMYLKSAWGLIYLPLFAGVLYCNAQVREFRDDVSRTAAAVEQAQSKVKRAAPIDAAAPTPEETSALAAAEAELRGLQQKSTAAQAVQDHWRGIARILVIATGLLLLIDAVLIPSLVRKRRAHAAEAGYALDPVSHEPHAASQGTNEDPTLQVHTRFTDWIDKLNSRVGEYVAYWAVIAVFAYYYEVLARYVFNSPTNWVHESMFLMFGMQYMLCGAYAYYTDQHVRVDVLYTRFSARGKALADVVTSVFFFIFTITMFWTGWRFAADAVGNRESSFTEWGIQYWPVKLAIPIGAALIVLQGLSKLAKDIAILRSKGA
jgi:TRAP-type mannitol/chloroaromatic compound transport system permease small subunit